jgi:methylphosphotriester-DNA--protein-cysteine methyltransferase
VIEIVEQNLSDLEFSTNKFSRHVAMSRMQLHRKLRALTDQSTHEYIRTYRLKRAVRLLQHRAGMGCQKSVMMSASTAFPILPRRFESNSGNRRPSMPKASLRGIFEKDKERAFVILVGRMELRRH